MTASLSTENLKNIASKANLSPSVHNTQPTRWHIADDNALWILANPDRYLKVGDPKCNDAAISCGAALMGTHLALSEVGFKSAHTDFLWQDKKASPINGLMPVARLELIESQTVEPLASTVTSRFTWRGGFSEPASDTLSKLNELASIEPSITIVSDKPEIAHVADMNDTASLIFFQHKEYRDELLSWMRLAKSNTQWALDGMNFEALCLNSFEAVCADFALKSPMFEVLDKLRIAAAIVSEKSKTNSSTALAFFHRPTEENPVESGMRFYKIWLQLTAQGFVCWPMAVVADNPETNEHCVKRYKLPKEHRLISVLRIGAMPTNKIIPSRARLEKSDLII